MGPLFGSTLLMICYLSFYIVLYKHTLTIFLSIIRHYKIIILTFAKFYNTYERLDCKPKLINASFMFKKQNFLVLLFLLKVFEWIYKKSVLF